VIGDLYEKYEKAKKEGKEERKVLDELDIKRYCCRRMFLSHVEVIDKIMRYPKL